MSNSIVAYALPLATVFMIALIIWAPTVIVFVRRRQADKRLLTAHLVAVLAGELAILLAVAAVGSYAGLRDAGGYLLAVALVIGALGPHALKLGFRRNG